LVQVAQEVQTAQAIKVQTEVTQFLTLQLLPAAVVVVQMTALVKQAVQAAAVVTAATVVLAQQIKATREAMRQLNMAAVVVVVQDKLARFLGTVLQGLVTAATVLQLQLLDLP
jgi:hypothetical protein